jgi:hypothetical protein
MTIAAQIQAFFAGVPVNAAASADASLLVAGSQPIYIETSAPLAAGAVFNGGARDMGVSPSAYHSFKAIFNADQASAASGAKIQMSNDAVTWRDAAQATLAANVPMVLSVPIVARYFRVSLTNAGIPQGALMVNSAASRLA